MRVTEPKSCWTGFNTIGASLPEFCGKSASIPQTVLNLSDQFPYVRAAIQGPDTAKAGRKISRTSRQRESQTMQPVRVLHDDFGRHERLADSASPRAPLTPTQMEVLRCVRSGLLNKQIAYE